jgi:hypothetical protein
MEIYEILVIIFATSSGLVCIYSLISAYLLFSSVTKLSAGEEFSKLVTALYITVLVGFIYTLWNLLTELNVIEVSNTLASILFSNILISVFFVMLAYLAFLTKQMSAKFGFKDVGDEIKNHLQVQKAVSKKVKRRKR